ncbi:coiled-coil domain-containing protein 27 [Octodon degus]|uniref:Coiled-coil domain-containing protein 27 n=1 Tax=Octodon degus TaxID=10160 RepID=A0A6P6D5J2_OCTDE|nr:coiled-coil domain-containing protein 27 [Octodon degus]
MFLKRNSGSERHSVSLYPLTQGLRTLHSVAGRDMWSSEQRLRQATHGLGRSALAMCRYYSKMNVPQAVPSLQGFVLEMEKMKRAFLARPGCPQFSTKATSVSQLGSGSSIELPRLGGEDWLLDRRDSDPSMDVRTLPGSKSACELSSRRRSSAQTPSPTSSSAVSSHRPPWYISVIHEKERSLLVLGEEMRRFSELEAKLQRKDEEILALQREMEALRKQLKCVLRSKALETPPFPSRRESPLEDGLAPGRLTVLRTHTDQEDLQLPEQKEVEYTLPKLSRELSLELGGGEEDQVAGAEPKAAGDASARDSAGSTGAMQEEAQEEEKEELEEEGEEDLTQEGDSSWGRGFSMTESFEDELLAQLEEYERTLLEFHSELDATRTGYCLAVGTIGSLQRQVAFLESQLGKVNVQNEALHKELGERKQQLQAMSDKFSRLREDKKHLEMMGLIEKDNLDLRQHVWDLESELSKRDVSIAELITKVSELQAQVSLEQERARRWKQLQEDVRGRTESIQQAEQQARVALESAQARLERLRSRIMQAAFSVTGVKALATEISDNDILEALQRVISERNDYYNQLKQTGVKVPPPQVEILPSKSKKILSK